MHVCACAWACAGGRLCVSVFQDLGGEADGVGALTGLGQSEQLSLKAGFILATLHFSTVSPDLLYYCLWIIFFTEGDT